ncbi:hypothetical protein L917_16933 [Phytophthora nicotianae]|uniref:Uncharacterized protein n=1 Tax=Phytophthora nicotianae TaxID=4792 RepID=W2KD44_PHYNI|nr:hypothetical protein L917_16933 [Phytophthora nicotianae]
MYLRRVRSMSAVIPYAAIPPRWSLIDDEYEDTNPLEKMSSRFAVSDVGHTRQRRVMSHNAKYKSAFAVCQRIAEVVADKGTSEFQQWLDGLQRIEQNARGNDIIVRGFDMSTPANNDLEKDINSAVEEMDSAAEDMYVEEVLRTHPGSHTAGKKRAAVKESIEVGDDTALVAKRRLILDSSDVLDVAANSDRDQCEVAKDAGCAGASSPLEEPMPARVRMTVPLVDLNKASRSSGRPRLQQSVKKSKHKTEFKESEDFARRLTTLGDITLESFNNLLQQQSLSLCDVEEVFDALRPMHSDAVFKRPKARLLNDGADNVVEDNVRGILPEALVKKCFIAIHNLISRTKSSKGVSSSRDIIAVAILNVGTFRAVDIDIMESWRTVSGLVRGARSLISWINGVSLEDPAEEDERQQIVSCIKTLDMRGSINSGGQTVEFAELVRFGNEGWLSDQCMVSAATRIAAEASRSPTPAIYVINPTIARFKDDEQRRRLLD